MLLYIKQTTQRKQSHLAGSLERRISPRLIVLYLDGKKYILDGIVSANAFPLIMEGNCNQYDNRLCNQSQTKDIFQIIETCFALQN